MLRVTCPQSIVPFGADQTLYLVVDSLGDGHSENQRAVERPDLETIISDLLAGEFNEPVRVLAFNTLEHWSEDLSREVADEIQARCDIDGVLVPEHVRDFVEGYIGPVTGFHQASGARVSDKDGEPTR